MAVLGPVIEDSLLVTKENGPRPAGKPDECFYCRQPLGYQHTWNCVLVERKVRVAVTVTYEVTIPAHWDEARFLQHRTGSFWCASNVIDELDKRFGDDGDNCMCGITEFAVVDW